MRHSRSHILRFIDIQRHSSSDRIKVSRSAVRACFFADTARGRGYRRSSCMCVCSCGHSAYSLDIVNSGGKYSLYHDTAISGQMRRFYLRAIPGLSIDKQRAAGLRAGMPTGRYASVYEEGRSFPAKRNEFIADLRQGDEIMVAVFPVLAADRKDMRAMLAAAKKVGGDVIEFTTGRAANAKGGAEAALDAADYWSARNKIFGKETPAEAGARGGAVASAKRKAAKMPIEAAAPIWRDRKFTTDQAVDAINSDPRYERKWSASQLYRELGPREAKAGRRPRAKLGDTYEG